MSFCFIFHGPSVYGRVRIVVPSGTELITRSCPGILLDAISLGNFVAWRKYFECLQCEHISEFRLSGQMMTKRIVIRIRVEKTRLCFFQEWYLHTHVEISQRVISHWYSQPPYSQPFISFTTRASRRLGFYFWHVYLMLVLITSMTFTSFAIRGNPPGIWLDMFLAAIPT